VEITSYICSTLFLQSFFQKKKIEYEGEREASVAFTVCLTVQ